MSNFTFTTSAFNDLSASTLYSILRLRSEVFVLEQTCLYQDMDNKDTQQDCEHVLMLKDDKLCGYARILAPNISYSGSSIGRVLIASKFRGQGLAKMLMAFCIKRTFERYPTQPIQIGAQCYLQKFYESLGFVAISEPYDEDGIMHLDMELVHQ